MADQPLRLKVMSQSFVLSAARDAGTRTRRETARKPVQKTIRLVGLMLDLHAATVTAYLTPRSPPRSSVQRVQPVFRRFVGIEERESERNLNEDESLQYSGNPKRVESL